MTEPTRTDHLANSRAPAIRRWESPVIGATFALLGLGAVALLYEGLASGRPLPNQSLLVISTVGIVIASAAMIVRWRAFARFESKLHDPGKGIGILSKLSGWISLGLLPASMYAGSVSVAVSLLAVVLGALGLWTRRAWVVWFWYLLPVALTGYAVASIVTALFAIFGSRPLAPYDIGRITGAFIWSPLLILVSVKIKRALQAWHRSCKEDASRSVGTNPNGGVRALLKSTDSTKRP